MTPPKPTRDHILLAQDVEGFLILLDTMALAGPETQKKMLLETAKRLKARSQNILHPVRNPQATTTGD
jgi:hypothetical protein